MGTYARAHRVERDRVSDNNTGVFVYMFNGTTSEVAGRVSQKLKPRTQCGRACQARIGRLSEIRRFVGLIVLPVQHMMDGPKNGATKKTPTNVHALLSTHQSPASCG
ncbi:hypothetical protein TWF103_010465 [Orbilia oligospora]|nr:hypothetical protein TWF103_010465 [Orbilia oligospora]